MTLLLYVVCPSGKWIKIYLMYTENISQDHYNDVIMGVIASQIISLTIVYSTVYSDTDQRKHQSSASLAYVWGIHRPPHKWPVTRKMFPFDDVIMFFGVTGCALTQIFSISRSIFVAISSRTATSGYCVCTNTFSRASNWKYTNDTISQSQLSRNRYVGMTRCVK